MVVTVFIFIPLIFFFSLLFIEIDGATKSKRVREKMRKKRGRAYGQHLPDAYSDSLDRALGCVVRFFWLKFNEGKTLKCYKILWLTSILDSVGVLMDRPVYK